MKRVLLFIMLIFAALTVGAQRQQTAQVDTMCINSSCITKLIQTTTSTGKPKVYAVYKDKDIEEIITVSQSVLQYIDLCRQNGINPSLGIRIRNGQLTSLVKYKHRYIKTKSLYHEK